MYKKGVTIIELVVVVAIISLLTGTVITSLNLTSGNAQLKSSLRNVKSLLQRAKIEASLRQTNERHGVYLDTTNQDIILYRGDSYSNRVSNSETLYELPPKVEITNVSLAGTGDDINFQQRSGSTSNSGTFELSNSSGIYEFTIDNNGIIQTTYQSSP